MLDENTGLTIRIPINSKGAVEVRTLEYRTGFTNSLRTVRAFKTENYICLDVPVGGAVSAHGLERLRDLAYSPRFFMGEELRVPLHVVKQLPILLGVPVVLIFGDVIPEENANSGEE